MNLTTIQSRINEQAKLKAESEWHAVEKKIADVFADVGSFFYQAKADHFGPAHRNSYLAGKVIHTSHGRGGDQIGVSDFWDYIAREFKKARTEFWAREFTARIERATPGLFD